MAGAQSRCVSCPESNFHPEQIDASSLACLRVCVAAPPAVNPRLEFGADTGKLTMAWAALAARTDSRIPAGRPTWTRTLPDAVIYHQESCDSLGQEGRAMTFYSSPNPNRKPC